MKPRLIILRPEESTRYHWWGSPRYPLGPVEYLSVQQALRTYLTLWRRDQG